METAVNSVVSFGPVRQREGTVHRWEPQPCSLDPKTFGLDQTSLGPRPGQHLRLFP